MPARRSEAGPPPGWGKPRAWRADARGVLAPEAPGWGKPRGWLGLVRRVAHWAGEFAIIWLAAAATAASFLPRGVQLNAQDQLGLASPSTWGSLLVAIPAAGLCAGIWWLLSREYHLPLAVAAAGLLIAVLFLPGGLTIYFLPSPLLLLAVAWVLRWAPGGDAADPAEDPGRAGSRRRPPARRP